MLKGKNVLVGVSGGIAVYKALDLVSKLKKAGANVDVIMTENATKFVTPLSFGSLSKTRVITDMFDARENYDISHISLAKKSDVFVIVPATANIIAKFSNGIADDMLSTTFLAATDKNILVCPAMNTHMYENLSTQNNINILKSRGIHFVEPDDGILACGDVGKGRLANVDDILAKIDELANPQTDYVGKTVLITAGATEENIDGVRVITNHSSGKMGIAIAQSVIKRGGNVILVYGNIKVELPQGLTKAVNVKSTEDMLKAVLDNEKDADIFIMAAAPADYKPTKEYSQKIKSETLTLEFEKNPDIAQAVGKIKKDRKLVIFAAETDDLLANAVGKLKKKNADMVVGNDVTQQGAGFYVDTNIATLVDKNNNTTKLSKMLKTELADVILDKILEI